MAAKHESTNIFFGVCNVNIKSYALEKTVLKKLSRPLLRVHNKWNCEHNTPTAYDSIGGSYTWK